MRNHPLGLLLLVQLPQGGKLQDFVELNRLLCVLVFHVENNRRQILALNVLLLLLGLFARFLFLRVVLVLVWKAEVLVGLGVGVMIPHIVVGIGVMAVLLRGIRRGVVLVGRVLRGRVVLAFIGRFGPLGVWLVIGLLLVFQELDVFLPPFLVLLLFHLFQLALQGLQHYVLSEVEMENLHHFFNVSVAVDGEIHLMLELGDFPEDVAGGVLEVRVDEVGF